MVPVKTFSGRKAKTKPKQPNKTQTTNYYQKIPKNQTNLQNTNQKLKQKRLFCTQWFSPSKGRKVCNHQNLIFPLINWRTGTRFVFFSCQLFYKLFSVFRLLLKCDNVNFVFYCSATHQCCYHSEIPFSFCHT